ncbi:vitamin K epoxide reductase family protein [Merismopedia glauca]|uniref:Vitamin K epoxide reductase domain-containing protein n=1 Tax=Merismopedia glauca CCAP 1448/3 TaxID=1296344 RepID=A0A2T1C8H0_9CYAN|nr:vitamin K epoxide reductase family protein [Merismopedia glauca]PSB04437.1 hypothetical protein C7B64_03870 [Merismopedia glauca CCAP 1448/3]
MMRRRSTPWIHRNSRLLIGGIAILGALLTGYLTISKLSGGNVACPVSGCETVLSSQYATVFGQPLPLFGCLAYIAMAVFAFAPLAVAADHQKSLRRNLENNTWLLLLAGSTAMLVFSGYLMFLLAFQIKALCLYCLGSALFSASLFILTLIGRSWEDMGQIFFVTIVVGMVTLISTLGVYATANNPNPPSPSGTPITTTSSTAEIELAKYLKAKGVKMYGAFWCPHCHEQKEVFGKQAFSEINYVECADPKEPRRQLEVCQKAKIESYPTWEINGKLVEPGAKSLEELAKISGYKGSLKFQNKI